MINLILSKIAVIIFLLSFSQTEKETVYLLFDRTSDEKCEVDIEGKGMSNVQKYRVSQKKGGYRFYICDEKFDFLKPCADTSSIKHIKNYKIVDLKYIVEKKNNEILRDNPFKKIFLIEKISEHRLVKYEVIWVDEWMEIE